MTTRTRCAAVVALALAWTGRPAFAGEVDLALEVRTARPTTVLPVRYRIEAGGGVDFGASLPGEDGTTPVALDLHVTTPAGGLLYTPFGAHPFAVAADGTITVPAGSPLSVSGTTITLNNDLDLPDFGIRMRKPTTLHAAEIRVQTTSHYTVESAVGVYVQLLSGATADVPLAYPLLGVPAGTRIRVTSSLNAEFRLEIGATGGLLVLADPAFLPVSVDAAEPEVVVIENTIDLPDFAFRLARRTNVHLAQYRINTSFHDFAYFPGPAGLPGYAAHPGLVNSPGATAHTDEVAFPLLGLAPNEILEILSNLGGVIYRVKADGTLDPITDGSRHVWDGPVAVIQNLLDFPDFRIRFDNPTSSTNVYTLLEVFGWGPAIPVGTQPQWVPGASADDGVAAPILGVAGPLRFSVPTSIATAQVIFDIDRAGNFTIVGAPSAGRIDEVGGAAQLVVANPISVRCRVYGESPIPPTAGFSEIPLGVSFWFGFSPIDPGPTHPQYRFVAPGDWPTGAIFRLEGMGPFTELVSSGVFGAGTSGDVRFGLNADGTARFLAPARNVTPWLGALDIDVDRNGVNDNVYYIEIGPLNTAPTATLSTGNFMITSAAQGSTVVSATVDDADGDALTCRWYVDDVLVSGPSAPTGATSSLDLGTLPPMGVGAHTIRFEVSDGELAAMPEIVVTVLNSPPDVVAGGAGVYEIGAASDVTLTGTVADFDGDELTYEWRTSGGVVLASGTVDTVAGGAPVALPPFEVSTLDLGLGVHTLTLAVEDEENGPVLATAVVEVVDRTVPTLAPAASQGLLWPPDHKMVEITVQANGADASGGALTYEVTVESSEPAEFDGDGNFLPDHEIVSIDQGTGEIRLRLRAERAGQGDGRVYTIHITATDAAGNTSTATIEVKAPHSKRK